MYEIGPSLIHGNGLFATRNILTNQEIDAAICINKWFIPEITSFCGRWINHSNNPNCFLKRRGNCLFLCAKQTIATGEELTADYNITPWFVQKPSNTWK
jgi:hypothetical protein